MKKDIHPKTNQIVFKDLSSGFQILTSSTAKSKQETEFEGKTYPMLTFDVSSASHPFYTGKQRFLDTEGRAERFMKKYKNFTSSSKETKESKESKDSKS